MNRDTILFISDLHLEGLDDPRQEAFVNWLEEKAPTLSRLVIGGDLFDLWIGLKDVSYYHYLSVLEAFRRLKEQGVEIDYVEGNHDFLMGPFFTDVLKANVFEREAIYYLKGLKIAVAHGDLLNPKERGYRCLRSFFRSRFFQCLLGMSPPSWIWAVGRKLSRLSRQRSRKTTPEIEKQLMERYRKLAEEKFRGSPDLDVLIVGHNHLPDHYSFSLAGKTRSYFNLGDWVKNFTYLEYRGEFRLKKFTLTPQAKN